MSRRVLVTGPVHGLARYAQAARDAGWQAIELPLLETVPTGVDLAAELDGTPDWICVTSANATAALVSAPSALRNTPVAIVGEAARESLAEAGYRVELSGAATAAELEEQLRDRLPDHGHVLWPRGSRAVELGQRLASRGITVTAPVVYDTRECEGVRLPEAEAVFLASPSAVDALARHEGALPPLAIAIGPTTRTRMEELALPFDQRIELSAPTPECLAEALAS